MAVTKVALVAAVMICMLIAGSHAEANLTCDQVTIWLTPCISYAVLGGSVSPMCCQGIHSLNAAYKNADDRRGACQCIKDKAAYILGIDYNRVNAIPGKCGTKCPYKVYPSTDCSKVK
ncbi:non-specific lipid-transfer protein 1-like [Gastrolobium bilobum]|uniref:non-specific lipid-transfer protein 1-like n=1 Tax=Gastrolobium bilobum TaxID=150636 RepID=UPI002AAF3855|nr:non-specific lipid-transfer protein 1-like [Gastrolobium bilobum]